jgi:hypothetical protein
LSQVFGLFTKKDIHVPVNYVELIKRARLEKPYEDQVEEGQLGLQG